MEIDPSSAIRKALTVILCIIVAAGILAFALLSHAFTFKLGNNLDTTVVCSLYKRGTPNRFTDRPGPHIRYAGEIAPHKSITLSGTYTPGEYLVLWTDKDHEWDSTAEFEIPQDVSNATVTVSIDFVPFKITIINPEPESQ
jgi:hypothetical protein